MLACVLYVIYRSDPKYYDILYNNTGYKPYLYLGGEWYALNVETLLRLEKRFC